MRVATLRFLASAHRWVGLVVLLPLALLALSGSLLVFRDALWVPSDWQTTAWDTAAADRQLAATLGRVEDWSHVDVARRGHAFHTIGREAGPSQLLPVGASVAIAPPPLVAAQVGLRELHIRLLLGEFGTLVVRIVGPLTVASLLVGTVLWWPGRRAWRREDLLLRPASRPALLRLHRGWGALVVLLVLPLVGSGALMAHNATIRGWLRPLAPPTPVMSQAVVDSRFTPGDLAGAIAAARAVWPDGELTQLSRPPASPDSVSLKFRLPGEHHPNGRSTLTVDVAAGRVTALRDARNGGMPATYDDFLYAFHIAELGGALQLGLWLCGALGVMVLCVTGLLSWLRRPRRVRA